MEKLPPTAYVRLVDIWLINGQLVPFIEVMVLTVLELNRDSSVTNHHGFQRYVYMSYDKAFLFFHIVLRWISFYLIQS